MGLQPGPRPCSPRMLSPFFLQMEKARPTFNLTPSGMVLSGHLHRQGLVTASRPTCAVGVKSPSLQTRTWRPEKGGQGRTEAEAGTVRPGPVLSPLCGLGPRAPASWPDPQVSALMSPNTELMKRGPASKTPSGQKTRRVLPQTSRFCVLY